MARLGINQYGKAETHLVRVVRDSAVHEVRDLTVSVALSGELEAVHLEGDNAAVLATDTQNNTVSAFAKVFGVVTPEEFAARLARHFLGGPITRARVEVNEVPWTRLSDHAFTQSSREARVACVIADGDATFYASGIAGLIVLKTTDSEFHGFPRDRYTTLQETTDRILATSLTVGWRYTGSAIDGDIDYDATYAGVRDLLLATFADVHSLALQQTIFEMGKAVLERYDAIAEISLSCPNKHHFLVDLAPFGLDNPGEVFFAADRPYGLIQATVRREDS